MMIRGTKLFIETQMSEWDLLSYCKTLDLKNDTKTLKEQCTVHLPYNLYLRTFFIKSFKISGYCYN